MGQHKHNETAKLAKEGKLPPKPAKIGAAESRRIMQAKINEILGPLAPDNLIKKFY